MNPWIHPFRHVLASLAILVVTAFAPAAASAATITVTDPGNAGPGTLRQAMLDGTALDEIVFAEDLGPITVTGSSLPTITSASAKVIGSPGGSQEIAKGGGFADPIFVIDGEGMEVSITGVHVKNGEHHRTNHDGEIEGGALRSTGTAIVRLTECAFTNNKVVITNGAGHVDPDAIGRGGAVYVEGTLFLDDCDFAGNQVHASGGRNALAEGGAVYAGLSLHAEDVRFTGAHQVNALFFQNPDAGTVNRLAAGGAIMATGPSATYVRLRDIHVAQASALASADVASLRKDGHAEVNGGALLLRGTGVQRPDVQRVDIDGVMASALNTGWALGMDAPSTNNEAVVNGGAIFVQGGGTIRDVTISNGSATATSRSIHDTDGEGAGMEPFAAVRGTLHIAAAPGDDGALATQVQNVGVYYPLANVDADDSVNVNAGEAYGVPGIFVSGPGTVNVEHVGVSGTNVANADGDDLQAGSYGPALHAQGADLTVNLRNSILLNNRHRSQNPFDFIPIQARSGGGGTLNRLGGNLVPEDEPAHGDDAIGFPDASQVYHFGGPITKPFADMPIRNVRVADASPARGLAKGSTVLVDAVGAPRPASGGTAGPVEAYSVLTTAPASATVMEGDQYTGTATFDQPIPPNTNLALTMTRAGTSTAAPNLDFTWTTPVALTPGQSTRSFAAPVINILDDFVPEATKQLDVVLGVASNDKRVRIADGQSAFGITIEDDDPYYTASISSASAAESAGVVNVPITVDDFVPAGSDIALSYGGSATRGVDFTAPDTVRVPMGFDAVNVPVTILNDLLDEAAETITITMAPVSAWMRIDPAAATGTLTIVDDDAPTLSVAGNPGAVTTLTGATFTLSGSAGVTGYECSFDGASFAACTSPVTFANLANGLHVFQARAVDSEGQRSGMEAITWTVAPASPGLTLTGPAPAAVTRLARYTVRFTTANATRAECSLNGGAFRACTSPYVVNTGRKLTGSYSLRLRAVAADGARGEVATVKWRLDRIAPKVTKQSPNARATVRYGSQPVIRAVARDTGGASKAVRTVVLRLDGKVVAKRFVKHNAKTGAVTYRAPKNLKRGQHVVRLQVADAAGNTRVSTWRFTVR